MLGATGMDMSGGGVGDIWSTGAFSFESPLKDLLDSGDYTLEQLLAEDELLQELRGCHQKLMEYFSTEAAVTKLVQYVILPQEQQQQQQQQNPPLYNPATAAATAADAPSPGLQLQGDIATAAAVTLNGGDDDDDDDTATGNNKNNNSSIQAVVAKPREPGAWLRQHCLEGGEEAKNSSSSSKSKTPENDPALKHIRFPYMACEIICCEIPGIIETLATGKCVFDDDKDDSNDTAKDPSAIATDNNEDASASSPPTPEIVASDSQTDNMELVVQEAAASASQGEKEEPKKTTTMTSTTTTTMTMLDLLFSLLHDTAPGDLDDYRAGYFDKILTVLFRKRPEEMTAYINSGGDYYDGGRDKLIGSMMKHLYSHSVMQIAQRLLLPQRPGEQEEQEDQQQQGDGGGDEIVAGEETEEEGGNMQCDWSSSPEVLDMLLDVLVGPPDRTTAATTTTTTTNRTEEENEQILDLSLNASEVLITIIQNSMLSSPTMLSLTSSDTVSRIVDAATTLTGDGTYFSPRESLLTSAMNVLESLILQLGGYGAVGTMSLLPEDEDDEEEGEEDTVKRNENMFEEDPPEQKPLAADAVDRTSGDSSLLLLAATTNTADDTAGDGTEVALENESGHLISDLGSMLDHLPRLLERLSELLSHPSTKTWTTPTQFSKTIPQQMLGNSRLRIVRVLESLVLLGDPEVDSKLVQSDCLEKCLDFFWEFQWCSMLHQSVANLLVHVFEGQNARCEVQEYFLVKCNLLGRLMDSFVEDEAAVAMAGGVAGLPHSTSATRITEVVENLQDVAMTAGNASTESEKGSSSDAPLPVSEDDVEAAMETQEEAIEAEEDAAGAAPNVEQVSTEAVRFESRDVSTVGDVTGALPPQVFRFGYMGHVIIICQALVHAYTNEPPEHDITEGEGTENPAGSFGAAAAAQQQENGYVDKSGEVVHGAEEGEAREGDGNGDEPAEGEYPGPKDDFGEPLLLYEIVQTHPLAERWHDFVDTTLAAETAVQSTPLGGYSMQSPGMDPMQSHRPGLVDEGYMMGDDGEGPPAPPRGMLGGGDVIDMDDNDLEIAASMMAGLSLGRSNSGEGDDETGSQNSGDSERSYNSGETASDRSGYAFDDPLGKAGGLGIELGKLTQYKPDNTTAKDALEPGKDEGDDSDSHSSSDEEPESSQQANDSEVPVMDLFAGNFNYNDQSSDDAAAPAPDFANFADFASGEGDDGFGPFSSAGDMTSSDQSDAKSAEIEDIFGKGDHAELLEQEDFPPQEASGNESAPVRVINPFDQVEAAGSGSEANTASAIEVLEKEASVERIPFEQDEIVIAPSDELDADKEKEQSGIESVEADTEKMAHTSETGNSNNDV